MASRVGVKYVLYATEEMRRAIKVVDLFLELAAVAAWSGKPCSVDVNIRKLHEVFPSFVRELSLRINALESQFYENWMASSGGTQCPAVTSHCRAYQQDEHIQVSHLVYLMPSFDPKAGTKRALEIACDVGVRGDLLNAEHLVMVTRQALEKMGAFEKTTA